MADTCFARRREHCYSVLRHCIVLSVFYICLIENLNQEISQNVPGSSIYHDGIPVLHNEEHEEEDVKIENYRKPAPTHHAQQIQTM